TAADFCAQLEGREGLRNLYLLTVADITTTSPTAMTSWKARMLDELYFAADAHLAGVLGSVEETRAQRVKAAALTAFRGDPGDLEAYLASMPDRYLLANAPAAIVAHATVALERARARATIRAALAPSR